MSASMLGLVMALGLMSVVGAVYTCVWWWRASGRIDTSFSDRMASYLMGLVSGLVWVWVLIVLAGQLPAARP